MCGIAGFLSQNETSKPIATASLTRMNELQRHRGPDGTGTWLSEDRRVGFAHTRLSIIDLESGFQPMALASGNVITYNGEIYNYRELREELGPENFTTTSDTEVILRAYDKWGADCVGHLRGMFAFALWDAAKRALFIARDRFGIKPFHFLRTRDAFYFSSESKALMPFVKDIRTDYNALHDYFCFQFCLGSRTLFSQIVQLQPAHCGYVDLGLDIKVWKYWEVHYDIDFNHTEGYFIEQIRERLSDSIQLHLRSDVEVGAYLSGGIDSSLVASMASESSNGAGFQVFTGRFSSPPGFDESVFARTVAREKKLALHEIDISAADLIDNLAKVIYHLDQPIAGPGSFPQYMVSAVVRNKLKVVLGGQGGDEIFGGYARYLLAYFEQCIKGAIDGTMNSGNFVVTYESIIPNLVTLQTYKPLIQEFWAEGIFDSRDRRYFRMINRSNTLGPIINWELFDDNPSFEDFKEIYWGENVGKESYFDSMTHFDFKTLLPALLHVEDRMSMAHGVESRVPFLDHRLIELVATIPADIKFQNGELKRLLRVAFPDKLPVTILNRKDKMGFPVPLQPWIKNDGKVRSFVLDTLRSEKAKGRFYLAPGFDIERLIESEGTFSRNIWALLSLELWQQRFHDQQRDFKAIQ
jgi:asparagine synthase (glutamine-hydrolysing)